jgi:hypothetical protein
MADASSSARDLKNFAKEASNLTSVLKELADALGKNAKEAAKFTGESAAAYQTSFSNAVSSAQELAGYTTKQLANKKTEAEFNKKLLKVEQDRARIQSKISELEDKKITASKAELEYIEKTLKILRDVDDTIENQLEHSGKLKKKFDEISKIDVFAPFKDMMGKIPYLNKAFPAMADASKKFRDSIQEGNNTMTALAKGADVLQKGLGNAAMTAVLGAAVDEFTLLNERSVGMQRNLGVSRLEALKMNDAMIDASQASKKLYFNSERFQEAQESVNSVLGSNGAISADMAENFAALHYQMGLSKDEATKFNLTSMSMGKNAKDYTASITVQTKLLNGQKKLQIDNREIIKGVANTSSRIQLSYKASGKNLAEAVYQAKALGLNMAQVETTADSLLDFESSIANELEAELLSGREYNLEKARGYALSNDMVGLAAELGRQNITAASFGRMNRLEQESTAKMLGMQVNELGDSLTLQEQLKSVSKESGYRDAQSLEDLQKKVSLRARMVEIDKDGKKKEIGFERALAEIGDEKLRNQLDANTLAERTQLEQKKASEAIVKLIGPEGLEKTMNSLDSSIKILTVAVVAMAGLNVLNMIRKVTPSTASSSVPGSTTTATTSTGPKIQPNRPPTPPPPPSTPAGSTGFLGKAKNFFGGLGSKVANSGIGRAVGGLASKLNPGTIAMNFIKKNAQKLLKVPLLSVALETMWAKGDIEAMIASATDKSTLYQQVGSRTWKGIGGIAGGILGGAIGAIGGPASILGAIGGNMLGSYVAGALSDAIGAEGMGKFMIDNIFASKKKDAPIPLAVGGITNGATNAIIGEAGREAVVPLTEFYAKIDELIRVTKAGQNIYIGPHKLNEATGLNLHTVG